MDWIDILAEWILFPLIIVYGFVSWSKDNPGRSLLEGFGKKPEEKSESSSKEKEQNISSTDQTKS